MEGGRGLFWGVQLVLAACRTGLRCVSTHLRAAPPATAARSGAARAARRGWIGGCHRRDCLVAAIAAHPRLLQAAEEKLCIEASAWPSQARVADRLKSGITAWAAAGLVKNLALSIPVQQELHGAIPCLCQLSHSPDWLENSKSAAALQHLGVDCQGYGKEL